MSYVLNIKSNQNNLFATIIYIYIVCKFHLSIYPSIWLCVSLYLSIYLLVTSAMMLEAHQKGAKHLKKMNQPSNGESGTRVIRKPFVSRPGRSQGADFKNNQTT